MSIIIVSWNCCDILRHCLDAIGTQRESPSYEIIVVDNASADATLSMLASEYPDVRVIANRENMGFASANNTGIKSSTGRYILLLNPDAFLAEPDTLGRFKRFMDRHPQAGMCGCKLIHQDGRHQVGDAGFCPDLKSVFNHSLFLSRLFPNRFNGVFLSGVDKLAEPEHRVGWICGACLFVRRSCIDAAGMMTEDIFLYGEDIEWGCRFNTCGFSVYYLKDMQVVHIQGGTLETTAGAAPNTRWIDGLSYSFEERNPRYTVALYRTVMWFGFVLRATVYALGYITTRKQLYKFNARSMFSYARHIMRRAPSSS